MSMKRTYQQMIDQTQAMNMEGVASYDFGRGNYYSPPSQPNPPLYFHNPFPSPNEYSPESYITAADHMGYLPGHRSLSEPFVHQATESFGSPRSSPPGTILMPPTTPPLLVNRPAVPITPGRVVPRQKAKRTATACEECRKRKQKCDGETPCQSCKEQKLDCRYREVCPTKKDNSIEKLISMLETTHKNVTALTAKVEKIRATSDAVCAKQEVFMRMIEKRLSQCQQCGSEVPLETGFCKTCNPVQCRL